MRSILLIGYGCVGQAVARHLAADPEIRISGIIVHSRKHCTGDPLFLDSVDALQELPDFALECAGHSAIVEHVIPLLRRGVDVGIISVGSLAEDGLPERLEHAAASGGGHLSILAGAVGGIDALAAARIGGLERVVYTGRKPPIGWKGTPAEMLVALDSLAEPAVIFQGFACEAARLFPKNANVAATVSLAGLGLKRTEVTLIADPHIKRNIHEIDAAGTFGEMHVQMTGDPLPENPKTSALTVYSAMRAIQAGGKRLYI